MVVTVSTVTPPFFSLNSQPPSEPAGRVTLRTRALAGPKLLVNEAELEQQSRPWQPRSRFRSTDWDGCACHLSDMPGQLAAASSDTV